MSLNLKLKSAQAAPAVGGGSNLCTPNAWGRCRPFVRIKSNLNTKSPWRRGAGQKSASPPATDRRLSHAQIFFCCQRFWVFKRNQRNQKPSHIKGCRRGIPSKRAIYFLNPRGPSKVWRLSIPARRARDKQNVANLRKQFFSSSSDASKNRREIRVGG